MPFHTYSSPKLHRWLITFATASVQSTCDGLRSFFSLVPYGFVEAGTAYLSVMYVAQNTHLYIETAGFCMMSVYLPSRWWVHASLFPLRNWWNTLLSLVFNLRLTFHNNAWHINIRHALRYLYNLFGEHWMQRNNKSSTMCTMITSESQCKTRRSIVLNDCDEKKVGCCSLASAAANLQKWLQNQFSSVFRATCARVCDARCLLPRSVLFDRRKESNQIQIQNYQLPFAAGASKRFWFRKHFLLSAVANTVRQLRNRNILIMAS